MKMKSLFSFVGYKVKVEIEERYKQENDFCKFADFLHISEGYPKKIKLVNSVVSNEFHHKFWGLSNVMSKGETNFEIWYIEKCILSEKRQINQ